MEGIKVLYRYEIEYKNDDGDTQVRLREHPIIRETQATYFIKASYPIAEKRVSKFAYNTFAYDTKEKAKEHFIRRTNTRIKWFNYWIEECEKGLELIEKEA
jgi:hypothetical protein